MFIILLIVLTGFLFSVYPLSPDEIREHFEWGEYDHLIDHLEPFLDSIPDSVDSSTIATYHCYLGVAYFSKEKIGEARKQFITALNYDQAVMLPMNYVTIEMTNLFTATKADIDSQKKLAYYQDSLFIANQQVFESNLKSVHIEDLQRKKRNNTILSGSFSLFGAAFLGIVAYQYYATKVPYQDFKNAALNGDKVQYEHFQPIIKRANTIMITCDIAAGASIVTGLYFAFKTTIVHKQIRQQE